MKLLYNARIHTQDNARPFASAILIARDRVLALGDKDELLSLAHGRIEQRDMQGMTILPGLTDAHLHLQYYSLGLQKIDCETDTKEKCLRRVAERVNKSKPGEWVLGHGWNQNAWNLTSPPAPLPLGEGGGWPSASDLDAITPNNPVYLTAKSLHAAWVNSAALKLANITVNTVDPKDGKIQRDGAGNATGVLLESAMGLVTAVNFLENGTHWSP
jgi:predicted amidohydrolase YtcJ